MKFKQAYQVIQTGGAIQSVVSKSLYELKGDVLLCEGLPVSDKHLTPQEISGEWEQVRVIESMDDYRNLTAEEKSRILSDGFEWYKFNQQYREGVK